MRIYFKFSLKILFVTNHRNTQKSVINGNLERTNLFKAAE